MGKHLNNNQGSKTTANKKGWKYRDIKK
jgi:hypothetical protein